MMADPVAQRQFFIKFIPSHFCKIISSRVEEHGVDQTLRTLYRERLTGTDFFIQLQKTFLIVLSNVLCKARFYLRFITKQLPDLIVRTYSQCTDQNGNRHLSCTVHTDIKNIIGICLVLQPCSPVRDDCTGKQALTDLIMVNCIVNARRTDKLADNNTFRAIDNKSTGLCHKGKITHENFMLTDLLFFFIIKTDFYFQRCCIGCVSFLAFLDGVFIHRHFIPA